MSARRGLRTAAHAAVVFVGGAMRPITSKGWPMLDDARYSLSDLVHARGIVEEHFDRAMRSLGLDPEDAADLPLAGEAEYTRALWKALSALEAVVCRATSRRGGVE